MAEQTVEGGSPAQGAASTAKDQGTPRIEAAGNILAPGNTLSNETLKPGSILDIVNISPTGQEAGKANKAWFEGIISKLKPAGTDDEKSQYFIDIKRPKGEGTEPLGQEKLRLDLSKITAADLLTGFTAAVEGGFSPGVTPKDVVDKATGGGTTGPNNTEVKASPEPGGDPLAPLPAAKLETDYSKIGLNEIMNTAGNGVTGSGNAVETVPVSNPPAAGQEQPK